jgi:hypothetical protein
MLTHRPAVPAETKRTLLAQAGNKCANPGCSNQLVEIHHIHEWHIYQTHDANHMIAICPSCHDAVDRGSLQISDDELYRWKGIDRREALSTGHIFVEPGEAPRLLLGSLAVQGSSGLIVFEFAEHHQLSFAVRDGDIMLLNVKISDLKGDPLLDVVDGYVRQRSSSIELQRRPGHILVPSGGIDSSSIPKWARYSLLREDENYADMDLPLLSLKVIDRGLVKVEGLWFDKNRGVAITPHRFSFLAAGRPLPVSLVGDGEASVINWVGPLNISMFR